MDLIKRQLITNDWTILPLNGLIGIFLSEKNAQNISTFRSYRCALEQFVDAPFMPVPAMALTLGHITNKEVYAFLEWQLERAKPATAAQRVSALKAFFTWVGDHVPNYVSPALRIKLPGVEQPPFAGLSSEQITALLGAVRTIPGTAYNKARNALMLEILVSTGIRADECCKLRLGQISACWQYLERVRCKGKKFRDVYISTSLRMVLQRFLTLRAVEVHERLLHDGPEAPLLASFHKGGFACISYKSLWRVVNEAAERAKISGVHPHLLRHSFAHGLLEETKDIRLVAQALGHSDVKITMRYTERPKSKIAEAIEAAHRSRGVSESESA